MASDQAESKQIKSNLLTYLFLTLLDLVKVSNPSGGVLTSSALNTLRWSQATCELIVMLAKPPFLSALRCLLEMV